MRKHEQECAPPIADARAEIENGSDPLSEPVQELVRRWRGLIEAFTGGSKQRAARPAL